MKSRTTAVWVTLSCVVLAAFFVYRSDEINDIPATAVDDAARGPPAGLKAPRVVVTETHPGAVFVDIEEKALDHERIDAFLAARPVAAYRVVSANAAVLRSYIRSASDQYSFGLLFLGSPRMEFGFSTRDRMDLSLGDALTDWNIDVWSGIPHGVKGGRASLIVDADDSVYVDVRSSTSQILVEPLGTDGHHVIWRSTVPWRSHAAAARAASTLAAAVESVIPEDDESRERLAVEAVSNLALMNTAASIRTLDDLLAGDLEESRKRWIVLGLFQVNTDESRGLIRKTAANPALSTSLRVLALRTTSIFVAEQDANLYRSMLYHEDPALRAESAALLSRIDLDEAQPHLVAAVLDESLPQEYWSAAFERLRDVTGNPPGLSIDPGQSGSPAEWRRLGTERVAEWAATQ